MDLNKSGQHGYWVDSRYQSCKDEAVEHLELSSAVQRCIAETPQSETDQGRIEQGVGDGEQQDGSNIVKERPTN